MIKQPQGGEVVFYAIKYPQGGAGMWSQMTPGCGMKVWSNTRAWGVEGNNNDTCIMWCITYREVRSDGDFYTVEAPIGGVSDPH